MNESTIHIVGDSSDAQNAFDRVMQDVADLRQEAGRATDSLITDSSRLARTQIQDSERSLRARTRLLTQQVRDEARLRLRAIQGNASLSAQERRAQAQALRDISQDRIRAFNAERDQNLERLRNARISIQTIASEERMLSRIRSQATQQFRNQLSGVRRSLTLVGTVLSGLGGIGIFGGFRFAIDAATQIDTLRSSFRALGLDVAGANRELEEARRLARLPGITLEGAGRALVNLRSINVVGTQAVGVVRELGNVLALAGESDLSGLVRAITQIAGRGEILQEEINQLTERAPVLRRVFEDAFGAATAEGIRAALQDAENQVDAFITRITASASELGRAPVTGAANTFQNFRIAVRDLAAAIGQLALPRLTQQIRDLTTAIEQNASAIAQRFESAINLLLAGIDRLLHNFRDLTNLLRAGLIAAGLARLASAFNSLQPVLAASSGGLLNWRTALTGVISTGNVAVSRIGLVVGAISRLSIVGAAVAGAFAVFDFIKFIRGSNNAANSSRSLNRQLNDMSQEANSAADRIDRLTGSLNTFTNAQLVARLDELNTHFASLRVEAQRFGIFTLPRDLERAEFGNLEGALTRIATRVRGLRSEIDDLTRFDPRGQRGQREELRDLRNEVEVLTRVGQVLLQARNARRLLRNEGERQNETTQESNKLTALQTELQRNAAARQRAIAQDLGRRATLRRRNSISEIRSEISAESTLREQAANRQSAIAQDLARRSQVITRNSIADARVSAQESTQVALQGLQNLGRNITAAFRNINVSLVRESRDAANSIVNEFERASEAFTDLQNRIERGVERRRQSIQRSFDDAARQTPEQQSIVDDFVGAGDADNLNRRLRGLYDGVLQERERLARGVEEVARIEVQRQISLIENLSDTLFNFAFDRDRTFRETAITFVRESLRIILQSIIETNTIVANNNRIATSYAQIADARNAAFEPSAIQGLAGIGNLPQFNLGNFATGGAGALGVAGLLFPQEFNNLVQGIGRTVSGLLEAVGDIPNAIGNITLDNTIRFDSGAVRHAGTEQARLRNSRRN